MKFDKVKPVADFKAFWASRRGWRQTATINTLWVIVSAVLMMLFLIAGWAKKGKLNSNVIFAQGECDAISRKNLMLHLLLNIFSTAIIASSNFFMQILNAPTRSEVDAAHQRHRAVEIGVPSIHNIKYVARIKTVLWALFNASSIPIHLFFNSAIFRTDYQGGSWNLTMASESFMSGAKYYPPGATLWLGGSPDDVLFYGLGDRPRVESYSDPRSPKSQALSRASELGGGWDRLEPVDCIKQYQRCTPRTRYQDVILVVRSQNESDMAGDPNLGWTRDGLFGRLDQDDARFWDPYVPADETNSLWFSSLCNASADTNPKTSQRNACSQDCFSVWGGSDDAIPVVENRTYPISWEDPIIHFGYSNLGYNTTLAHTPAKRFPLQLQYCLAERVDRKCKLGLANNLVFVVACCLALKACLCVLVLYTLREDPLVTPGDAIASFLVRPDHNTRLCSTTDATNWDPPPQPGHGRLPSIFVAWPHIMWRWARRRSHLFKALPLSAWLRNYAVFFFAIGITAWVFTVAMQTQPLVGNLFSDQGAQNGILSTRYMLARGMWSSVLLANTPQILLSVSYFMYNALYTRIRVEKEWNSYSTAYQPLRVTDPQGEQRSTYRLQLPYHYSIPLIAVSIALHWLVSNTIYVFIIEGGYYFDGNTLGGEDTGLSDDTYVGIGYSSLAILCVLVISCVLITIPVVLSVPRLRGDMVLGGSNSIVLSSACHACPLGYAPSASLYDYDPLQHPHLHDASSMEAEDGMEMQVLLGPRPATEQGKDSTGDGEEEDDQEKHRRYLLRLSQSRIRWGEVRAPMEFKSIYGGMEEEVGHLSFGTVDDDVQPPVVGKWYA